MKAYIETTVTDFAKNAMSDYIEETVTNRAIPAFQDGLKPVQRKILWAMYKMGLFYNLSHKKSAKVTGEVIAKYNPHGDCLSGDTKIYATDGNIYEIKDLIGKELEVWCWDKETNSIVSAKAENFRTVSKDNLYTIEFSNGTTLKASGNHPILLENGTYCSVENLKENTPVYGGYLNLDIERPYYILNQKYEDFQRVQKRVLTNNSLDNKTVIHHKDHNPKNNKLENLEILSRGEHALHHKDYLTGLSNGIKTMFQSGETDIRKQMRAKNSELMKQYNQLRPILMALKYRDWMKENNIEISIENYEKFRLNLPKSRGTPHFDKLSKYGIITIEDFLKINREDYHIKYDKPFSTEKNDTKKCQSKKLATFDSKAHLSKALNYVRQCLKIGDYQLLNYENYRDKEKCLKIDTIRNLIGIKELFEYSPSQFLFVKKITKETGSFTLYDFTVPKYENMMVMLSNHSFLIVHNSSAYMAMGNMAQAFQKYNFIDGQGNWGAWSGELPAASRYTECRLSELAQTCLLDKDYLKVVPMVDNYDGTEKEPAYLPARLPFILLLNISGIATAVRTGLPSFDLKALTEVCIDYLKTGKMKTNEIIPITTINGGKCISTKEEQLEFYNTGSGVLKFQPSYIMGKDRMIITGVQDDFNFEKVSDNLLDLPEIKSVKDEGSTEIKIGVYFKGNLDQKALDKIISKTQTKCIYSTNILINKVNEENVPKAKYKETNIYSLVKNWCKFRVGLEIKHLKNQICEIDSDLKYQNTLLLAEKNLDIIFQSLKDKDPKSYLLGKLRCSEEEIDIILNLAVKRLSRLSTLETEKKIADLENQKSDLQKKLEKPEKEVIKDLSKLKEKFG